MMQVDVLKFKSVYSGFLFAENETVVERKRNVSHAAGGGGGGLTNNNKQTQTDSRS